MKIKLETPKINLKSGVKTAKKLIKSANDMALDISEDVLDGSISRGEEWQKIAEKSVKGGLKLMVRQQDMFFDTLEIAKGEYLRNRKRFSKLFSLN